MYYIMHTSLQKFYDAAQTHIELFNAFVQKYELKGRAKADHICYKCDSSHSFEEIRALFESQSAYIYQAIISGRRIAYIKMKEGIECKLNTISFLELSDQKPDRSQQEGFDHIEVYPIGSTYEEMVHSFQKTEKVIHVERPHHTTDDIDIGDGFVFRCTHGPLIDKIKQTEFV